MKHFKLLIIVLIMEFQEMSENMESLLTTAVGCGSFVIVNERHKYNQHIRNEYNVTHVNK